MTLPMDAADRRRNESHSSRNFAALAAGTAVIVAACLVGWAMWGFSYDDAYITYRYAQNFALGDGLVFNAGERVLGTTAPGYAVLLGLLTMVVGSPVAWGSLSGLLGLLATAFSPWLLPPSRRPSTAWIALWGLSLVLARWHVELLGAETLVVLGAMSLAGVLAFGRDRLLAAGWLAALATSIRFDAVLACGALGLALWIIRRRFPWHYFAGTLPAGATVAAVTAYFGSPLPQTLAGKRGEFADRVVPSYTATEWGWLTRDFGEVGAVALLMTAILGCVLLAVSGRVWRHPLVLVAFAWVLAVETFYRLVQVPFSPWYHVMTVALLLGLGVWGCLGVAEKATGRVDVSFLVASVLLLPVLWMSMHFLVTTGGEPPDPRWRIYRDVGEFLARETEPGRVAMVEIGVAGYFAPEHEVLDLVGLVSPVAAEFGAAEALRLVAPRYVVDASLFHGRFPELARLGTAEAPNWLLLRTFEDPASGRGLVRVLERGSSKTRSSQTTASPTRISESSNTWP